MPPSWARRRPNRSSSQSTRGRSRPSREPSQTAYDRCRDHDPNEVSIGKTVTYTEVGTDDPETYTIVGSDESDPLNGKISNDSPIAQALLGKKKGEKVTINTPGGTFDVTINDVKTLN